MKEYITRNGMLLDELAFNLFGDEYVYYEKNIGLGIAFPHYLGFYKGIPLEIFVSQYETTEIWFSNCWKNDNDLRRALTIFYMDKGIYPFFDNNTKSTSLIVKLEKL